jgi:hypothetical protein
MMQKTQMPWLPSKGFDLLAQEAFQRGIWEDLNNGSITKNPKPKLTQVVVSPEGTPDDAGKVRLKIETSNAGSNPKIYYQEDGEVTTDSTVLNDNVLVTNALRVQFLAVDPTGKNQTGSAEIWTNTLTIRNRLDEVNRTVQLFVAPKGKIRYTLDGSEARNGMEYTGEFEIGDDPVSVYVFAEYDGIEAKHKFSYPAAGSDEVVIIKDKPATLYSPKPKKLDSSAKTYEGLKVAKEKNIQFEQVSLVVGTGAQVANIALGEMLVDAAFIEAMLLQLQTLFPSEASVIMSFKKVHVSTGYDLEQFIKLLGIEISNGEVIQE